MALKLNLSDEQKTKLKSLAKTLVKAVIGALVTFGVGCLSTLVGSDVSTGAVALASIASGAFIAS